MVMGMRDTQRTAMQPPKDSAVTVMVRYDRPDGTAVVFETAPGAVDPASFQLILDTNAVTHEAGLPSELFISSSVIESVDVHLSGRLRQLHIGNPAEPGQDPIMELYRMIMMDREQALATKRNWSEPFGPTAPEAAPASEGSEPHDLMVCMDQSCPFHGVQS